ncbi:MAG: DUF721 domain-containing protein [Armatimonadota bacterium]
MAGRGTATAIRTILGQYLRRREMDTRARQEQVRLSWREIVGDVIARVSSIQRIADGVVYVRCATPVWAQTLSFRRKEILAKVAAHAGGNAIREIRFNSLPESTEGLPSALGRAGKPSRRQPAEKPLSARQEQTVAAIAASLSEKASQSSPPRRPRNPIPQR